MVELFCISLPVLRRSSSLEPLAVFSDTFSDADLSRGGKRAAVAGLASGSGLSVAGVVGAEFCTGLAMLPFELFSAGNAGNVRMAAA